MKNARTSLRWNLAANFFGQTWRALMSLLFVPFYLNILGVEAYGLIGLYVSLQLALALLDGGLRPTLAREMARFAGGGMDASAIRILLRSIELPLAVLSAIMILITLIAAPWLAAHWVHAQSLDEATVTQAFRIMGMVASAQFLEAAYDSSLNGLQRQVVQNAIVTLIATLRGFGALAILWMVPTLTAFFLWQGAISMLSCFLLALAVYRTLPPADCRVGFSVTALKSVQGYALGMLGIALIALLLTQSDKIVLAHYMSLSDVGQYTLAASLAGAIAMLSGPIGNAFFPRLTQMVENSDDATLKKTFHQATRLVAVLIGTAAAMLMLFGEQITALWLNDAELAREVSPILAFLALSSLLSSLSVQLFQFQLAHGLTKLNLRINLVLLVFLPFLIILTKQYGPVGAAIYMALLNFAGMTAGTIYTARRFPDFDARRWWLGDVLPMLGLVFGLATIWRITIPAFADPILELAKLAAIGGSTVAAGMMADRQFRAFVLGRIFRRQAAEA